MSAYNDIFIAALAGNVCQHIIHFQGTVRALFQYGNGVGVYLPASALLPFLGVCLERLVIAVLVQRADTGFFQAGYDVAGCYLRTMHACFASLQFVIGQKLHNGFCRSTVDALQSFFERGLCM